MTYKLKTSKKTLLLGAFIGLVLGIGISFILKKPHPSVHPSTTESGFISPDGKYTEIK